MPASRLSHLQATLLVVGVLLATAGPAVAQTAEPADDPAETTLASTDFGDDPLWSDGLAEVAEYDATRNRYGNVWSFPLTMITVKEEFNPVLMVKSDSPELGPTLPVMKIAILSEMPTFNYPYRFATNIFVDRRNPFVLRKLVHTSSEWCGITTLHLRPWLEPPTLEYHSYFENENDGAYELRWPENGVTEEQLFFAVRALPFSDGYEQPVRVLGRLIDSHVRAPVWREGQIRVVGREEVADANGVPYATWRVEVDLGDDRLVYNVGVESPHLLVYHEGPDDVTWRLRDVRRWAYWQF